MYTSMKFILDDAAKRNYAVIACSPINMEMARGMVKAAYEQAAPLIFIMGSNQMRQHSQAEVTIPMIRAIAEKTPYPLAVCLDHGMEYDRITYAFRNGFSGIMYDGSSLPLEENIKKTREVVQLCKPHNVGVEGEVGHVGMAASISGNKCDSIYTSVEDAVQFVRETQVDCVAVSVGTAHGEYPESYQPHINFARIREIKAAIGEMPIALHGGSGTGDANIIGAVEAGINKVNVATDIFIACREYCKRRLAEEPNVHFMQLMKGVENTVVKETTHWIGLTNSAGKGNDFPVYDRMREIYDETAIGQGE